ncbi:hypothetical protein A6S26_17135 [Nostoc sp. ATCC 43529]|nr:hypothetical protein A6S26_17135 [Nostoc sp. ATCC 43529]
MTNKILVGTWKLISWETKTSEGIILYPFGKNVIGYLSYTDKGYMSAMIMRNDCLSITISSEEFMKARTTLLKPLLLLFKWQELKTLFKYLQVATNYISYSGKYEIQGNKVLHHVEISFLPDWIGTTIERTFEITGEKLLLISPPIGGSPQYLTWQRV